MTTAESAAMRRDANGAPLDQPILGRCALCDAWVTYVVQQQIPGDGGNHQVGHLLEPVATRGGDWAMVLDGRVSHNRNRAGWGQSAHRCHGGGRRK